MTGDPPRHRVEIAPAAQREFGRLRPDDAARLRGPVLALALGPRAPGAAKLAGSDFWRVRLGDLRLVYRIDDERRLVVILRLARRSERTYRRLRG